MLMGLVGFIGFIVFWLYSFYMVLKKKIEPRIGHCCKRPRQSWDSGLPDPGRQWVPAYNCGAVTRQVRPEIAAIASRSPVVTGLLFDGVWYCR